MSDPQMRAIIAVIGMIHLCSTPAAARQDNNAGVVFGLIDDNEWCSGGSVFLDLRTGIFMLYPRLPRPACTERRYAPTVERGTLGRTALERVRSAAAEARGAGLRTDRCKVIISNGGPRAVVITASGFSARTPEDDGCWSQEAKALYDELFNAFGEPRGPRR